MTTPNINFLSHGQTVIDIEKTALEDMRSKLDDKFNQACDYLFDCKGRIVVTGMGKSGHIGGKIAATLASTGSPAFFVHPGEASHGDLGMITPGDVVVALSNSGETSEVVTILPLLKRMSVPLVSLTGNPDSTLARAANINLDVGVHKEACPLNLAPTASTTTALVMGDALAVALLEARGFTAEDFAMSHPGGSLGRRLLLRCKDIMHAGSKTPVVNVNVSLRDALVEMTSKGLGMTAITDDEQRIRGIFTDGDLRRMLDDGHDVRNAKVADVMTKGSVTVNGETLAAEALLLMEEKKINALLVADNDKLVGALNMHDLLRAGVV